MVQINLTPLNNTLYLDASNITEIGFWKLGAIIALIMAIIVFMIIIAEQIKGEKK